MFTCLFVCLSVCLSICLSIFLFIYFYVYILNGVCTHPEKSSKVLEFKTLNFHAWKVAEEDLVPENPENLFG